MNLVAGHKIAAIGAGSGLGLGVVRRLIEDGASLSVLEISGNKVAALKQEFGDKILAVSGDAAVLADLDRFRAAHIDRFGAVDALICFQGIFDGNVPLAQIDPALVGDVFDELFRINVTQPKLVDARPVAHFNADGVAL